MMKLWFRKKVDKPPGTQALPEQEELMEKNFIDTSNICVADSISPGSFQVFVTLKGKSQGKPKTKETKLKRLQYLSVVLIFSVSLVTHSYIFLEQHLVKALVTPIVLMISGFFYDKVWAASDAKPQSEPSKTPDPNPKSDPAAPTPDAKSDSNASPASPANNTPPAPAASTPATPAAGAPSSPSNSGGENPSATTTSPGNNASPTNANPSMFPANSGAKSTPTSFKGDANKEEEKKKGEGDSRFDPLSLDETRVKILLSLNDREKELKKREEFLQERENIVKSLEVQLQRRGKELNDLKATIESLSKANNQYAEKNLKKLVDIYEAMKPPAAAKIFDDLPQSVLVGLIKAMNQKKASAIMAVMNQDKVRALTNILAMIPQVPEKEIKKA